MLFRLHLIGEGHYVADVMRTGFEIVADAEQFNDSDWRACDSFFGTLLPALDALGDRHFLLTRQQRHYTHLAHVNADGIRRLIHLAGGEVEFDFFIHAFVGFDRGRGLLDQRLLDLGFTAGRSFERLQHFVDVFDRHGVVSQFLTEVDELAFHRIHELDTALIFFKPGQNLLSFLAVYLRNSEDARPPFFAPARNWGKFTCFWSKCLFFPFFSMDFDAIAAPQGFNRRTTSSIVIFCNTRSTAESTSRSTSPKTVSIFTPTGQSRLGGVRCNEKTPRHSSA